MQTDITQLMQEKLLDLVSEGYLSFLDVTTFNLKHILLHLATSWAGATT